MYVCCCDVVCPGHHEYDRVLCASVVQGSSHKTKRLSSNYKVLSGVKICNPISTVPWGTIFFPHLSPSNSRNMGMIQNSETRIPFPHISASHLWPPSKQHIAASAPLAMRGEAGEVARERIRNITRLSINRIRDRTGCDRKNTSLFFPFFAALLRSFPRIGLLEYLT